MSSTLRITGMATGMDTDNTVKQLMQSYQARLDKMNQDKQIVQWRQELYRGVYDDLKSLQYNYLDQVNPTNYLLRKQAYSDFDVKAYDTGTNNLSIGASATAITGAVTGNYKIDFTGGHIAAAAGAQSNDIISSGALASTSLSSLGITTTKITVGYTSSDGSTDSADIDITGTMTLSGLAQAINSKTSNSVVARFSELTGKFTIQTTDTGADTGLSLTDSTGGNLLLKLKLGTGTSINVDTAHIIAGTTGASTVLEPKDLIVKITPPGGTAPGVTVTKSSNSFVLDSIYYKFTSDKATNGTDPLKADIIVSPNVQKTYDRIKGFIDKYNELVDKLNSKIDEKKQSSYLPLTDEQKRAMKTEEIQAWEAKAKEGLLKNDSIISNMLDAMRRAFYEGVKDAGITLSDVGLSTSSDFTQRGKIFIDETKLKNAIQNNGEQVEKLFSQKSTSKPDYSPTMNSAERATRSSEEGIFQRISDILLDNIRTTPSYKGQLLAKAGIKGDFTEYENLLSKDIKDRQKKIDDMTVKIKNQEAKYYAQFSQLETAMNRLNSQSNWLAQQLGTMGK